MTTRHRRRALRVEAIAPWVALRCRAASVVGRRDATGLGARGTAARPSRRARGVESSRRHVESAHSRRDRSRRRATLSCRQRNGGPTISATRRCTDRISKRCAGARCSFRCAASTATMLVSSFTDARGSRDVTKRSTFSRRAAPRCSRWKMEKSRRSLRAMRGV